MEQEKNCHVQHRQRLINTIIDAKLSNVSEIQQMEFILTLILPQGDVNPLAHKLLEYYGSIAKVLDADWKQLAEFKGLAETSAKKLSLIKPILDVYIKSANPPPKYLSTPKQMYDFAKSLYGVHKHEILYIVSLGNKDVLLHVQKMCESDNDSLSVSIHDFLEFAVKFKAKKLLLIHNHPNGNPMPSMADVNSTKQFKQFCLNNFYTFYDHIIIGNDSMFSFERGQLFEKEQLE